MQIKSWQIVLMGFILQILAVVILIPDFLKNIYCTGDSIFCIDLDMRLKEINSVAIFISLVVFILLKSKNWKKIGALLSVVLAIIEIFYGSFLIYVKPNSFSKDLPEWLYLISGIFFLGAGIRYLLKKV